MDILLLSVLKYELVTKLCRNKAQVSFVHFHSSFPLQKVYHHPLLHWSHKVGKLFWFWYGFNRSWKVVKELINSYVEAARFLCVGTENGSRALVVFSRRIRNFGKPLLRRHVVVNRVFLTGNQLHALDVHYYICPCNKMFSSFPLLYQYRLSEFLVRYQYQHLVLAIHRCLLQSSMLRFLNTCMTFHVPSLKVGIFCFCNFSGVKTCSLPYQIYPSF